jgi:hypothetical protein
MEATENKDGRNFVVLGDRVEIRGYRYELPIAALEMPEDNISEMTVTLQTGLTARFGRINRWSKSDVLSKEVVENNIKIMRQRGLRLLEH